MAKEERVVEIDLSLLNERQRKAIEYIKEHGKITNKEYRELCKVGWDTAHRDLQMLASRKMLKREGSGKPTYYQMIKVKKREKSVKFKKVIIDFFKLKDRKHFR